MGFVHPIVARKKHSIQNDLYWPFIKPLVANRNEQLPTELNGHKKYL